MVLGLGLSLLMSPCPWAVTFTGASQVFIFSLLDETGRLDGTDIGYFPTPRSLGSGKSPVG